MTSVVRSLFKTVTWRVIAVVVTMSVSYIVTDDISVALTVGAGDAVIKSLLYFLHERAWDGRCIKRKKLKV